LLNPIAQNSNRHFGEGDEGIYDPIHVADLDTGDHDPFHEEESKPHRWLITTCIAGVAGSLVIGASILGLFSDNGASTAQASVNLSERWQRPTVSAKSDLNGTLTKTLELRPLRVASVAYQPDGQLNTTANTIILRQNGNLAREMFNLNTGSISASAPTSPSVLSNDVQLASISSSTNTTTILKKLPPEPVDEIIVLQKGETLISRLVALGVTSDTATQLTTALEPVFPAKLLRTGQKFVVTLDKQQDFFGNFVIYPVELTFSPGPQEDISVESNEDGQFFARVNGQKDQKPSRYAAPHSDHYRIAGRVTSSLFAAALDKGVPEYITNQVIRAFSHDVDFQRDIKVGAKFEIYFGKPFSGSSTRRNVVHYAALEAGGKMKKLYRFTNSGGKTSYYDQKGRGATKFLMRTPISGARISSGYGMRRHPVLGYSKMHTGIDFAAPRGTPIRSAGSGKIVYRARKGGYGRVIEIRHSNGYMTRYAHMSRYAGRLQKGSYVNQGQVIGYVGSSGRTTGAHLHYEVRINNRTINPRRVRVAGKQRLRGKNLKRFTKHRQKIVTLMKKLPIASRFASISN